MSTTPTPRCAVTCGSRCVTTTAGIKVGVAYPVVFDGIKVPVKLLETVTTETKSIELDSMHLPPREIEVSTEVEMLDIRLKVINGIFIPFITEGNACTLVQSGCGRYIPIIVELISADAYIHVLAADKELQDATDLFVATPEDRREGLPRSVVEMAEMNLAEENWLAGLQYPEDKPDMVVYRVRPPAPTVLDVCKSIVGSSKNHCLQSMAETAIKTCNTFRIEKKRK